MNFWIAFVVLAIASPIYAAPKFSSALDITPERYTLEMNFAFSDQVSLPQVAHALRGEAISRLRTKIVKQSIFNQKTDEQNPTDGVTFDFLQETRNFGLTSQIYSKCSESLTAREYQRHCEQDMTRGDAAKFMFYKKDETTCGFDSGLKCKISMEGKFRPLVVFGIQILDERNFALRSKVEAIRNYAKLFSFLNLPVPSFALAAEAFDSSTLAGYLSQQVELKHYAIKADW